MFDVAEAMRVAREVERFDWSWSVSDIERLQSLLAPIEVRGLKVYSATSTELDVVVVDLARIPSDSVDDAERAALRTELAALRTDLVEAWGEPYSHEGGEPGSLVWVFPQVVVELTWHALGVYYRLVSPDAHGSVEAAERASRERDEQRTDFAPFLAVLPRIANAHLGSWSRSDLDPLFEAVGWPLDISEGGRLREDLVAELNGDAVEASLRASWTSEYMYPDQFGFGEYWQLELSQSLSLSPRVVSEAHGCRAAVVRRVARAAACRRRP